MLEEAIGILRELWAGETVDHRGDFYEVDNARLFDPPEQPIPVIVSGFGDQSVELAGRVGDGYWGHTPERDVIGRYRASGGDGPRYAQIDLCWGTDAAAARKTVHHVWPNGGIPGQLSQDLPTWKHFEQAAQLVTEEAATKDVPCGAEIGPVIDAVEAFVDAGYDHVYFHQIGPDQDGFLGFWSDELRPALTGR
jgi:G6PDH family F420-dependent oxidoreductase